MAKSPRALRDPLVAGACLLLQIGAAPAGAAQSPAPPADICLTNACARRPGASARDEAAVTAAIREGRVGDLVRAGGTAREVGDLLRAPCADPARARLCDGLPQAGAEEFQRDERGGVVLAGRTPNGTSIVMRIPGTVALPGRASP